MAIEPGSRLGYYEVIERLGAGGMGEVYRARDSRLDRAVAVKVLTPDAASDKKRLKRFLSEAKAVSALNHPNILTLHEIGESESGPFLVTELIKGRTVRDLLKDGPLPVERAVDYAIQAAEGLAKAHESGIVHRDLKPENLMVTDDGFVKILDFGLAKLFESEPEGRIGTAPTLTESGTIVGTVGYVSPEQLRGEDADPKSDLFGLGTVLFEMLTGRNPFLRETTAETLNAILHASAPGASALRPEVPEELSAFLEKALAKVPGRRFAHAYDFAAELRGIRARFASDSSQVVVTKPSGKERLFGVAGMAVLAAVIAVLLVSRAGDRRISIALPAGQTAVAVLPVYDATGDPELGRAGIGRVLTDGFVQILSDVPGIYVVSPIRLHGVALSLGRNIEETGQDVELARKVSERAQADAILSGNLSKVGNTFVLNATLTELSSERLIGTFRAESGDRDGLLSALTEPVSQEIRAQLSPDAPPKTQALDGVATSSLEAYTHFMRGRILSDEGRWEAAVPELKKAVTLDDDMGLAWSVLACAFSFSGEEASSHAAQRKAEDLLNHVNEKERRWIELNGTWIKSGNGALYRKEVEQFIRDFPDDREGYYYAGLGAEYLEENYKDAIEFYETAYELTPNFYAITKSLVDCHIKMGRPDRAIKSLERYLSLPMISEHGRAQAQSRLDELRTQDS